MNHYQLSVISYQLPVISYQLSIHLQQFTESHHQKWNPIYITGNQVLFSITNLVIEKLSPCWGRNLDGGLGFSEQIVSEQ